MKSKIYKIIKKIFCVCLMLSFLIISGCGAPNGKVYGFEVPKYYSNFTQEEHIERISEISKRILDEELNFYVEILYGFNGDPEYFMVQTYVERVNDESIEKTCDSYLVGFIYNEAYYKITNWIMGENPYSRAGVMERKKYFGNAHRDQFAWVDDNGNMVCNVSDNGCEIKELSEDEYGLDRFITKREIEPYQ